MNRNINVALPTLAERLAADPRNPNDPDALAGQTDVAAPDGPNNEVNTGYLWDSALRAGLTVRNYGFFIDGTCYNEPSCAIPLAHDPAATSTVVATPTSVSLTPFTDPYFRGFDNNFPDYYRYTEWERDFDANYAKGGLPSLSLVRLMHDHTGNFGTAIDLVNTPETQQADNDYAVGLLVQKIANSIYANDTLIFVIEDDAQDGGDHVDSHRTIAFVAGAYVKQQAVVSTPYNTLDFLRTIEEVLGLPQMNLNDALAKPMADIFNTTPIQLELHCHALGVSLQHQPAAASQGRPAWWCPSRRTTRSIGRGSPGEWTSRTPIGVDFYVYNRILWKGMMGNKPYPAEAAGSKLGHNQPESEESAPLSPQRKTAHAPNPDRD